MKSNLSKLKLNQLSISEKNSIIGGRGVGTAGEGRDQRGVGASGEGRDQRGVGTAGEGRDQRGVGTAGEGRDQ